MLAIPIAVSARAVRIVGVVEAFPTTDPTQPAAIVDLATLGLLRFRPTAERHRRTSGGWTSTTPRRPAVAPIAAAGRCIGATVVSRGRDARAAEPDPLALAMIGALSLGFVVAGLFAVIGLVVSAAVSARQRRTEFALLRALGLSPASCPAGCGSRTAASCSCQPASPARGSGCSSAGSSCRSSPSPSRRRRRSRRSWSRCRGPAILVLEVVSAVALGRDARRAPAA